MNEPLVEARDRLAMQLRASRARREEREAEPEPRPAEHHELKPKAHEPHPRAPKGQRGGGRFVRVNPGDEVSWRGGEKHYRGMVIGHHDEENVHVWEADDAKRPHKLVHRDRIEQVHSTALDADPRRARRGLSRGRPGR